MNQQMLNRQNQTLAAVAELYRLEREHCAVESDVMALMAALVEVETRFQPVIEKLAMRSRAYQESESESSKSGL